MLVLRAGVCSRPGGLVPELFAVPVDWWICHHLNITVHFGLTGQSHVLFRIAEQLQAKQRIDPLVNFFEQPFGAAIFRSVLDDNVATAARSESHAVHNFVRSGIQLDSVPASYRADVVAFLGFNRDLFVYEFDCWHVRYTVLMGLADVSVRQILALCRHVFQTR